IRRANAPQAAADGAQNAVMAFQPHPPPLATHWHSVRKKRLGIHKPSLFDFISAGDDGTV
ncbi:MAG: hypothetical protein LKI45_11760, partial [Schleiferilactobacillus harbinensis]|nr:hypothetical protein [Schleiferilactobacillus harbinensis]